LIKGPSGVERGEGKKEKSKYWRRSASLGDQQWGVGLGKKSNPIVGKGEKIAAPR